MPTVPVIPESAPFTAEQRAWLNGFLAGLCSRGPAEAPGGAATPPPLRPLTILFGSQTGTAEGLARAAAREAGRFGFAAVVTDMAGLAAAQLAREQNVLVITSTHGEGDPPDNAKALHAALAAADAPRLSALRFSVCALGDTHYTHFCQCGKDFDTRLAHLGGTRVHPRVDCDADHDKAFRTWLPAALAALANDGAGPAPVPPAEGGRPATSGPDPAAPAAPGFSRTAPFPAPVLCSRVLNGAGATKEVRHVELALADSGLAYEPGDALGVFPQNCPELVDEVLAILGCDGEEAVPTPDRGITSFRHALVTSYDLGRPTAELAARYAAPSAASGGAAVATATLHVIDVLLTRPEVRLAPAEFVGLLRRLAPRLYSIASSPRAHPGQVHLTVATVRYAAHGRTRKGVCSTYLAERWADPPACVPVYVHANPAFRLPAGDPPLILVGPGTGIAPFRGFLHERVATGSPGRAWLFFGDRHAATDHLYREEFEAFARTGVLTRHDTAFSRDQPDKIYVQHRLREQARELFAWLEEGAYVYVCGDASRMARDVDAALHEVVVRGGGRTPAQAAAYVQALTAARRYRRDVY